MTDKDTTRRELRALEEAIAETGARTAVVVTLADSDALRVGGVEVPVVPAWRWLLETEKAEAPVRKGRRRRRS